MTFSTAPSSMRCPRDPNRIPGQLATVANYDEVELVEWCWPEIVREADKRGFSWRDEVPDWLSSDVRGEARPHAYVGEGA